MEGSFALLISGQPQYDPAPGSYDDDATKAKGDAHSVKGRWAREGVPLLPTIDLCGLPRPGGAEAYRSWAAQKRANMRLEAARKAEDERQEPSAGEGHCGSASAKVAIGLNGSFCEARMLGGSVGLGLGDGATMTDVQTAARTAADLEGLSHGFQGGVVAGVGVVGEQCRVDYSWLLY